MNELKYALRRLAARPGFSVVCILTLGLGIGVNVAIFALVYGVLLKPLPYPTAERLVTVSHKAPALNLDDMAISTPLYLRYREQAASFEAIAMIQDGRISLTGLDQPMRVRQGTVTASAFKVFGLPPLVGRPFGPQDEKQGAAPVVLISQRLWRGPLGGDRRILGRRIEIDGSPREIIGVMPSSFEIPDDETDVWLPLILDPEDHLGAFHGASVALLKPGVTVTQALADLKRFTDGIVEQFPEERAAPVLHRAGFAPLIRPLLDDLVGQVRPALLVLLGGVGFILLMACANVANLFLVRAESRQRELAMCSALGASRARLVGAFAIEGLVLALIACAASMLLAYAAVRLLIRLAPEGIPRLHGVELGVPVLLFALGLALMSAFLFAFLPLISYTRIELATVLREGGWGLSGRGRARLRKSLVAAQFALGLVLIIGAGLLVRSFTKLSRVDPGFDVRNGLTLRISLPSTRYDSPSRIAGFVDQLTESIEALPGVSAASAVSQLPLAGSATASGHSLEDFPLGDKDVPPVFLTSFVSPGYLKALGLRLVEGRWLEPTDHQRAGQVAVLSQSIAKKYWPNSSALGHRIRPGRTEEGKWYTIIGVVGDVHHTRLEEEPTGIVYYPMVVLAEDGGIGNNLCLVLRTATVPETLTTPVRSAIWALDPNVPITNVMTLEQLVREARAPLAFSMLLMLVASALALLLGAIGIYGVISFVVSQRTQEIGVRMALGAAPQQVRRMVLLDGLKVAWPGIAIGLAGSFALTRLMRSQLYEVSPLDLQTFVLVPLVLTLVTMLSSLLPARRAARVDPAVALRTE